MHEWMVKKKGDVIKPPKPRAFYKYFLEMLVREYGTTIPIIRYTCKRLWVNAMSFDSIPVLIRELDKRYK